jgi:hypothetical protein
VASSTISTSFDNLGGVINVQSGKLILAPAGGSSNGGTFTVAASAALDLTGGKSVNYAGTYTGSGAGHVQLNSGTINVVGGSGGATFSFPSGLFDWTGGTINTDNGTLTIAAGKSIQLTGFSGESLTGGGTLVLSGTINQTGVGNLTISGGTTLSVPAGGLYDLQNDSGIQQAGAGGIVVNAGTLEKTVGTNISIVATLLNNTGTVLVNTGILDITGAVSQITGTTLEAGKWMVTGAPKVQSTLEFAAPAHLSSIGLGASVTLTGPNSSFTNLASITSNAGSLSVLTGASFTTAGAFTNSGSLNLGAPATLNVTGNFAQTTAGTITDKIDGRPATGNFGRIVATGTATLGGTLSIIVPSSFTPTVGDVYTIVSSSSDSGTFGTLNGLSLPGGLSLTPGYNANSFTLTVSSGPGPRAHFGFQPPPPLLADVMAHQPAVSLAGSPVAAQPGNDQAGPAVTQAVQSIPVFYHSRKNHPGHSRLFHAISRTVHSHPAVVSRAVPAGFGSALKLRHNA